MDDFKGKIGNGLISAAILACFAWAWHLESRITRLEAQSNVVARVERLETLVTPLLIEFKVDQEVKKKTHPPKVSPDPLRSGAEKWAKQQFPNQQAPR